MCATCGCGNTDGVRVTRLDQPQPRILGPDVPDRNTRLATSRA